MGYFPFYIDITDKHCLVVGGGKVALGKIEILMQYQVNFTIIALRFCNEIQSLASKNPTQFCLLQRAFEVNDVEEKDFVIAATSDEELNRKISLHCQEKKILVNVVDVKEECSFIMPAIIHHDSFDIAISSGGRSPAAASYLKRQITHAIPENYSELVWSMGEYRDLVKKSVSDQKKRADIFQVLLEYGLEHDCKLTKENVDAMINRYVSLDGTKNDKV